MGEQRQCALCGRREGPFEHAAYREAPPPEERQYVGWLCQPCARQHGSHMQFATAMLAVDPAVWFVSQPETPLEARYRIGGR